MPNLITQYDNGSFEAAAAGWGADFQVSAVSLGERSADFAHAGTYSGKMTTLSLHGGAFAGGQAALMKIKFPGVAGTQYDFKLWIRCGATIPDEAAFYIAPELYDEAGSIAAGDPGYITPVKAYAAKTAWREIRAVFRATPAAGEITLVVFLVFNSAQLESALQYAGESYQDFLEPIKDYNATEAVPLGSLVYVDDAYSDVFAEIPVGVIQSRKLYYVLNVFYLQIGDTRIPIDEPIKWDDIIIEVIFDEKTKAFRFEFSDKDVLLEFDNKAGRTILLDEYHSKGVQMDVSLLFGELNTLTNLETIHYTGHLNPEAWDENPYTVKMNVEKRSFSEKLRTNFDKKLNVFSTLSLRDNLPLDPILTKELFLHPRLLTMESEFTYNENVDVAQVLTSEINGLAERLHTVPPFKIVTSNIEGMGEPSPPEGTLIYSGLVLPAGVGKRRFYISAKVSFKFTMSNTTAETFAGFAVFPVPQIAGGPNSSELENGVNVFYARDYARSLKDFDSFGNVAGNKNYGGLVSGYIDLEDDEAAFIKCYVYTANNTLFNISNFEFTNIAEHELEIREESVYAPSVITAPMVHDLVNKQLEIILDVKNPLKSNFFGRTDLGYAATGPAAKHFLFNGLAARNFKDKPFNVALKDLFNGLDGLFCLAMSVERDADEVESVRLEPIEYFFKDHLLFELTTIANYRKRPADKYIFNGLHFGFSKYPQDGQADSLEDFMSRHESVTPLDKIKNELSVIIDFILSGNYLEYTRRESFKEKPTKTYETDNNIFCVSATEGDFLDNANVIFDNVLNKITILGTIPASIVGDLFSVSSATGGATDGFYKILDVEIPFTYDKVIFTIDGVVPTNGAGTCDISILPLGRYKAKRNEDFEVITGVPFPESVYNLEHHIKRITLRWAKVFQAGWSFFVRDAKVDSIKFISGPNNTEVRTKLKSTIPTAQRYGDSLRIDRKDSAVDLISQMDKPLFGNNIIEVDSPMSWTDFKYISMAYEGRNPDGKDYGFFKLTNYKGEVERGWAIKLKFKPTTQMCNFTLIEKYNA